jgi:acyl-coenzyme A synthetase/AMP-(fatty) acid ligase
LRDYQAVYREFSLDRLEREVLQGSLAEGLNACIECCDRWEGDDRRIALEWIGHDFIRETVTFRELAIASARFANLLCSLGIGRGDVVAGLLPRIPELLAAVLGTWRVGGIYQPLFMAFGPAAIEHRVTAEGGSQAKLIVTDAANRPKLDEVPRCPSEDQVTASVVGAIAPKLQQAEIERARRKPTENLDACDYFLRGTASLYRWTREGNTEALTMFYKAIELDPG